MSSRSASSLRRTLASLVIVTAIPLLVVACKKPAVVVPDAEPPPPPVDAAPTVLEPTVEDAGDVDAADAAKAAFHGGPRKDPNVAHLSQCCSALNAQASALGTDPMGAVIRGFAAQCQGLAAQAGQSGTAPELSFFRTMLKTGKGIPAICSNL